MAELTANGIRFNVVRLGPGDATPEAAATATVPRRPVVFLHGLIMDNLSSFYYTLAPGVAATTDTVLYDLRGHGRSERPLDGYRIEDGVDDLFAILDGLDITEPVHLVANSFGGHHRPGRRPQLSRAHRRHGADRGPPGLRGLG